jgi:hypothetical protein
LTSSHAHVAFKSALKFYTFLVQLL